MANARYQGRVVFCADVAATARALEQGLGLRRESEDGGDIALRAPVDGHPEATVELYLHPAEDPAPDSLGTFGVDDVDRAAAELEAAGAAITRRPVDEPWGVRTVELSLPGGHGITLSAPAGSS